MDLAPFSNGATFILRWLSRAKHAFFVNVSKFDGLRSIL